MTSNPTASPVVSPVVSPLVSPVVRPVSALELPPILVITGTGTGVGKTVATAALAAHALAQGLSVCVVKPVQTGVPARLQPGDHRGDAGWSDADPPDVDVIAALLEPVTEPGRLSFAEFVRLPDPLSPPQAARRAGQALPPVTEHADRIHELGRRFDLVLVEGAGGVLVRLDDDGGTLADLAALLPGAQVVVATEPGLGTLNVTELTVEALRRRGIPVFGLVLGRWPGEPGLAEQGNLRDLPELSQARLLGVVHAGLTAPPVLADPPPPNT